MNRAASLGWVSTAAILIGTSLLSINPVSAQNSDSAAAAPAVSTPAPTAPAAAPVPAPPPARLTPAPSASPETKSEPKSDAKSKTSATYVIGALDVLAIKVWNNANLTGLYDVRPDGMIALPLVGEMKADGLTPEELRRQLTTKIGEFITDPEVSIDIAKINSKKYYIMGEGAAHPGPVPLTEPITVLQALATAGGFQTFANTKKIYVLRGTQKLPFNYKEALQGKNLDKNITIQNGDMIVIP